MPSVPLSTEKTSVRRLLVATVNIPVAASAVTLASLINSFLTANSEDITFVVGFKVTSKLSDKVTDRPAIVIGHSVAQCISFYDVAVECFPPVVDTSIYIGAPVAITGAVVEIYLK